MRERAAGDHSTACLPSRRAGGVLSPPGVRMHSAGASGQLLCGPERWHAQRDRRKGIVAIVDISKAKRPTLRKQGSQPTESGLITESEATASFEQAAVWHRQYPADAQRFGWLQQHVLLPQCAAPVNPRKTAIDDAPALTQHLKDYALELGVDAVGVAELLPQFTFAGNEALTHTRVIAYAVAMQYDLMAEIGPSSQQEVHRVYFKLLETGVRLAHYIGSYGYEATAHPNEGPLAYIPHAYFAGLGELGKHGSLISPTLGSSFRLGLLSTDLPLVVDGPQDYGIDDKCARCNICTTFCPPDAIGPEKETVNGVTRWIVDTEACFPFFTVLSGCKICLMVCPFNGRSLNKESFKETAREIKRAKTSDGFLQLLAGRTPYAPENPLLSPFLGAARTDLEP